MSAKPECPVPHPFHRFIVKWVGNHSPKYPERPQHKPSGGKTQRSMRRVSVFLAARRKQYRHSKDHRNQRNNKERGREVHCAGSFPLDYQTAGNEKGPVLSLTRHHRSVPHPSSVLCSMGGIPQPSISLMRVLPKPLGAPGLDFQTGDTTTLNGTPLYSFGPPFG